MHTNPNLDNPKILAFFPAPPHPIRSPQTPPSEQSFNFQSFDKMQSRLFLADGLQFGRCTRTDWRDLGDGASARFRKGFPLVSGSCLSAQGMKGPRAPSNTRPACRPQPSPAETGSVHNAFALGCSSPCFSPCTFRLSHVGAANLPGCLQGMKREVNNVRRRDFRSAFHFTIDYDCARGNCWVFCCLQ